MGLIAVLRVGRKVVVKIQGSGFFYSTGKLQEKQ